MEYTQWGVYFDAIAHNGNVLILVVMEYTQWDNQRYAINWCHKKS